ncbi:MAG: hypothetical protein KDB88_02735 [Flavobacteriales bacterium]|nr:hypothetical protein [Flavobacteriales bacterium]
MDHRICIFRPFYIAILGSALLLQGCGEAGTDDVQDEAPAAEMEDGNPGLFEWVASVGGEQTADSLYSHFASTIHVTAQELEVTKGWFNDYFRLNRNEAFPARQRFEIPWIEIEQRLPAEEAGKDRAIVFHHGLQDDSTRLGWSYRKISEDPDISGLYEVTPAENEIYEYVKNEDGSGQVVTMDMGSWEKKFQTKNTGKTYYGDVEIWRVTDWSKHHGYWDDVNEVADTKYTLLHWEDKMVPLHRDNSSAIGDRSTLKLVVHFTADRRTVPGQDEEYIAHTETVHLNADGRDLIGDDPVPAETPFLMHGANYGNLCPHRCERIERQRQ